MSNDHDGTDDAREVADDIPATADASSTPDPEAGDVTDGAAADAIADADDTDDPADVDETAEATGDDTDGAAGAEVTDEGEPALVGAGVGAGSARAAARRSAAVKAGITEGKGRATAGRDDHRDNRGNIFQRLMRFLREVVAELKKVIWPARKQMITYSIVVIVFVTFMVALVYGLDALFAQGVLSIFG